MVDCHLWTGGTHFLGISLESAEQMASRGWMVTWDLPHEAGGTGTWDLADWGLCWKSLTPECLTLLNGIFCSSTLEVTVSSANPWVVKVKPGKEELGTGVLTAQLEGDRG